MGHNHEANLFKMSDGAGMYLEVMPRGSQYWWLKYHCEEKEKRPILGVFPDISPTDARVRRDEVRRPFTNGSDAGVVRWGMPCTEIEAPDTLDIHQCNRGAMNMLSESACVELYASSAWQTGSISEIYFRIQ